jgi:hypothetical protein
MLSAIGKLFNWESSEESEVREKDIRGVPFAEGFSFSEDGQLEFIDESHDSNVRMKTGCEYVIKKYPYILKTYRPNKDGCIHFILEFKFPHEDVGYYLLGMSPENLSNFIEVIDDENFKKEGYVWKIIMKDEIPENVPVYDHRIFMNDFMFHYFNFGFMHDLVSSIKID